MEELQRKERMISGVYITFVPPKNTYTSVVSCETVIITLTIAVLNDMIIKTADIMNT